MGEAIDDASAALIAAMLAEDAEREAFGLGLRLALHKGPHVYGRENHGLAGDAHHRLAERRRLLGAIHLDALILHEVLLDAVQAAKQE